MTPMPTARFPRALLAMLLTVPLLLAGGCANQTKPLVVEGFNVPHKAALDAPTVVHAMRQAGFSDDHIVDHGPAMRNALATQGGVRLRSAALTLAMFMVRDDELFGVAINRGAFHLPLRNGSGMRVNNSLDRSQQ